MTDPAPPDPPGASPPGPGAGPPDQGAGRPGPPDTSPAVLLVALGRQVEERLTGALKEVGLSLRLMGALGHLAAEPGLSYSELAGRARVTPQSMHTTVAALIESGAVSPAGPGRGRRALLQVTPRGQRLLAAGRDAVAAVDGELRALGGLPTDQQLFRLTWAVSHRTQPGPGPGPGPAAR